LWEFVNFFAFFLNLIFYHRFISLLKPIPHPEAICLNFKINNVAAVFQRSGTEILCFERRKGRYYISNKLWTVLSAFAERLRLRELL
jgi:hypothetical protein